MLRKITTLAFVGIVATTATFAGLDMYTSKNYTTLLAPAKVSSTTAVSNSAVTGVDVSGLPGVGALVFAYRCQDTAADTITFQLLSCATSNGTYVVYTNASGVSSWAYTNAAGFSVVRFVPNSVNKYMRVTATPSVSTNGSAAVLLVSE
jgi:hypothetical protein